MYNWFHFLVLVWLKKKSKILNNPIPIPIPILTPCVWCVIASKRNGRFLCGWCQSLTIFKLYMIHFKISTIDWEKAKLWGMEVIPIFSFFPLLALWSELHRGAHLCTMISNFPTNKQTGEWSEKSKRESEQSVAEQITKREERKRSTRGALF